MDQTTQKSEPGALQTLQIQIPYQTDPLALYRRLCGNRSDNILLESAEIDSKQSLKSLLMVDSAIKFTCQGQQVQVDALTSNGRQLLPWLAAKLSPYLLNSNADSAQLIFDFSSARQQHNQDEDSRLRSVSNMEPLRIVQQEVQQEVQQADTHPLSVFIGGVFAYDFIASFEDLPAVPEGANCCPDYVFYLAETLLIVDHQQQTTELLAAVLSGPQMEAEYLRLSQRVGEIAALCQLPNPSSLTGATATTPADTVTVTATPDRQRYEAIVRQMQEHILAGDIFQVVPSRQFELNCHDSLRAYAHLKQTNPSPYMFYIRSNDFQLFGASPESALKYQRASNQVELYPIAGTRPRGKNPDNSINPDLDSRLELALRMDKKELAEHLMLVDLSRNDLARIAIPGTRHVADLLKVDRYSHVMHLVSRVVAQLADDLDALHAYQACMNMGTLVGAPKLSAASLIREVEGERRGSYGGAVGYLAGNGDMDTCIVIRSAFVRNQRAIVQAGAGVVHDSDPASEVAETEAKARAVIHAIQLAEAEIQTAGVQA